MPFTRDPRDRSSNIIGYRISTPTLPIKVIVLGLTVTVLIPYYLYMCLCVVHESNIQHFHSIQLYIYIYNYIGLQWANFPSSQQQSMLDQSSQSQTCNKSVLTQSCDINCSFFASVSSPIGLYRFGGLLFIVALHLL